MEDYKFCSDCKHFRPKRKTSDLCSKFPSPVDGKAYLPCIDVRFGLGKCQPEAKFFEPKSVEQSALTKVINWVKR